MPSLSPQARRLLLAFLVSSLCGLFPGIVLAQPTVAPAVATQADLERLEKRIRDLEEIIRRMDAERSGAAPVAAAPRPSPSSAVTTTNGAASAEQPPTAPVPSESPAPEPTDPEPAGQESGSRKRSILAGWDNDKGFILRSSDDKFLLRVTGQIQSDYRAFVDGTDYTDIDTFLIRRARLGIEADMFTYYEFRLLPDFTNAQAPGVTASPRLQDAYANVRYWDAFQVEVGKFKQPFSYEQLIQDRFVPIMERSLIDQLVPSRDEGLMIHGQKLLGDRLDYGISVSNGEINGDFDSSELKDLNGRIAVRPLNSADLWPVLRGLQLGIAGTTGVQQEPVSPNALRTPATVLWFQFNPAVRADGLRNRWSPEVAYFYGPLGLAAQYFHQEQRLRPAFFGPGSQFVVDVPFEGFYVMGTLLLTGEERQMTYSLPVIPLHPFNPCHPCACAGAWELVARVSRLTVGDEAFTPFSTSRTSTVSLADPTRFSSGATEMTLGFNWYLNAWARVQFNWEHAWFDDPVRLGPGPGGLLKHQDSLLSRFQIIF